MVWRCWYAVGLRLMWDAYWGYIECGFTLEERASGTDTDDGYLQPLAIEQLLKDSDGQHSCHSLESCSETLLGMRNVKFLNHGPRRRNE